MNVSLALLLEVVDKSLVGYAFFPLVSLLARPLA